MTTTIALSTAIVCIVGFFYLAIREFIKYVRSGRS